MKPESKRIFIADLPESITDTQLEKQFSKFGQVTSIDIKQRKENSSKSRFSHFAYINIDITQTALLKCFQSLSKLEWNGHYIQLELARESFLDRLKRERQADIAENVNNIGKSPVKHKRQANKDEAVESYTDTPMKIHKKSEIKTVGITVAADYSTMMKAQKSLIKHALTNVDRKSNKIVFKEDDKDFVENKEEGKRQIDHLFDPSDDGFHIKEQFEGKRGQKLLELQTKFNHDKRFMLDERFVDDDDDDENEPNSNEEERVPEDSIEAEKNAQLRILENVLNCKFNKKFSTKQTKTKESKKSLPSDSDNATVTESKKESGDQEPSEEIVEETTKSVEKTKGFYKVADNLKDALKTKEKFSLLSTFGKANEKLVDKTEDEEEHDTTAIEREEHLNNLNKKNPFKYDSSDNEDEDIPHNTVITENNSTVPKEINMKINRGQFWNEPFFFTEGDPRLEEAFDLIDNIKPEDKEFSTLRQDLKHIAKSKVRNVEKKNDRFKKKIGGRTKRKKQIRIRKAIMR